MRLFNERGQRSRAGLRRAGGPAWRGQECRGARRREPIVRSLQLQAALTEFIAQAADSLHADVAAGQEVPFELASQSGRGRGAASLYSYPPVTDAFVAERFPELRRLDP